MCLELIDLAFFDADCEVVSPDLKVKIKLIYMYTIDIYRTLKLFFFLNFNTLKYELST